jgi:Protein of unknown function (DUF1553)/Protein of unknown function (DUF1549)/Planctomycete cytochrome C
MQNMMGFWNRPLRMANEQMQTPGLRQCLEFLALLAAVPSSAAGSAPPDFNREVRPILSAHCFKCHGPDENVREAGLRLDQREAATRELDSGAKAIVPGQLEKSEVVRRIVSTDKDELMPPPVANKPLTDEQRQILQRWIAAGAKYEQHWAFETPRQAPLPTVRQADWPRNAIDAFILARQEQAGLAPSPDADRYALARRASLDLVGLPPTPDEADSFVNDSAPDAYERLIDRLLASPHYGQRWARRWLDLARYADTNGYEKDRVRSMWPYRDWVIRSLNADLPFDQFTIEQLAGDMLPDATLEQRIATGFHRNTMINEEGGIDPLEFRFYAMVDRVNTTATVWLGLTLGCAQCHTHKFDPFPHTDYYRQMALLNNADEPTIDVPLAELTAKRQEIQGQIAKLEADLPDQFPAPDSGDAPLAIRRHVNLEAKFAAWLAAESAKAVKWALLRPLSAKSQMPTLTIQDDGSVFSSGDITKRDAYDLTLDVSGLNGITALRLEAIPDERLPRGGPGRIYYEGPIGDFWLSEITATPTPTLARSASEDSTPTRSVSEGPVSRPLKFKSASHSFAKGKNTAEAAIDGDPQSGWSIDGGQGRTHYAVFQLDQPLADADTIDVQLLFERYYAGALGRFRIWATADPSGGEARDVPRDVEELLLIPTEKLTADQRGRLLTHFLQVTPELAKEREAIKKLRDSLPAYPTTLVMQQRPATNRRATFVHHRGEFLQPKDQVEPEVLSIFSPLPPDVPHDRLAYARWLVSPANPLVGRVTMNRHWASIFGTGLVRTTEDFGYQGESPSHPDLLDWLAVELPRRGWSMKGMHRLLLTSSTYRQSAAITPEAIAKDPQNRLLSHFPRVRLEAEMVRDAALRVSGLLSDKIGGPSVFPPQPPGITSEGAYGPLAWNVSSGEDRYRRGLYTFAKRTAPYAMFATFDGPSGEACIARREVSNTPLQALTLLNNESLVEAAQALGRLAAGLTAASTRRSDDGVHVLVHRCLSRPPTADEFARLVQFYDSQKMRLEAKELDAGKIAGSEGGDVQEIAAWTLVARAIMNLDEFITKE